MNWVLGKVTLEKEEYPSRVRVGVPRTIRVFSAPEIIPIVLDLGMAGDTLMLEAVVKDTTFHSLQEQSRNQEMNPWRIVSPHHGGYYYLRRDRSEEAYGLVGYMRVMLEFIRVGSTASQKESYSTDVETVTNDWNI